MALSRHTQILEYTPIARGVSLSCDREWSDLQCAICVPLAEVVSRQIPASNALRRRLPIFLRGLCVGPALAIGAVDGLHPLLLLLFVKWWRWWVYDSMHTLYRVSV